MGPGARPGRHRRRLKLSGILLTILGIVAFAVGMLFSIGFHEAGHFYWARRFGMRVPQFMVGFGPTVFSRRRGETEYGLKAIPLGGFCKIVGMTPQDDDVSEQDQPRAMWRYPVWKRTVVMSAGSITHACARGSPPNCRSNTRSSATCPNRACPRRPSSVIRTDRTAVAGVVATAAAAVAVHRSRRRT